MGWTKEDLTNYSDFENVTYKVELNGKVDIILLDEEKKVSVHNYGMKKLVEDWFQSDTGLTTEEKEKLKGLL
ncbi:hypothetical protein GOP80_06870 [Planococcaceae bacterium Storch 2/2-2]|nr:hypothetical protein [Planococcaceae bacterium Storch 2/2-2]